RAAAYVRKQADGEAVGPLGIHRPKDGARKGVQVHRQQPTRAPGSVSMDVRWCNVTVAQGMGGDGKKEDLTGPGWDEYRRTPKVRSSMELLQRLRERYLQFVQVVVDVVTAEVSYRDFEERLRQELDALGRDIVKWVVEASDEHLREEPQARPGWVVARRGDEKQLLTPFGMVSYQRTYFRHRAGK